MADFDAETFAQIATGDVVDDGADSSSEQASGAANHADAEGGPDEEDVGSESSLREMFMSTEPNTSLGDVDDPWDPDRGGTTRIYRGLQKMLGFTGAPAIVDLAIGAVEAFHATKDSLSSSSSEDEDVQEDVDDDRADDAVDYGEEVPTA